MQALKGAKMKTYKGLLSLHSWGEADDILFLSSLEGPFAEELEYDISGKMVTARYWITDIPMPKSEAQDYFIRKLVGDADVEFGSHYSEVTGYLWTDEECNVGGHDLIEEFKSYVGKYLILEVEIHNPQPKGKK